MNKHCYRIIFNRERGMLMVVSDIAKSYGGAEHGQAVEHIVKPSLLATLRPLSLLTTLALGATLFLNPAHAKIVADASAPGNQQPQVTQSSNGTPQVNIQTPSAGGVSKNKYSQFDVDQKGVILNNSRNTSKTELGGYVTGNNNLAAGEAKIILNEVNSRNPSHLNGYIEVAGKKAQVIIANPSGITCDGCGFINADRATLTTGQVLMENGNVTGYNVQKGSVKITGKGLDSSRQDYTEIISRSAEVNAGIWANDLKVVTGRNNVSKDLSSVTPHSGNSDDKPEFAIDVAHLGGMYANKIHLIGTESGVGVRNAGKLGAQAGSVIISANGRIENSGTIQSRDELAITTTAHLNSSGKITSAEKSVNIKATSHINNSGDIISQQNVNLTSSNSHITNSKNIAGQKGAVTLQAAQQIENNGGHIQSGQNLAITSGKHVKNSGNIVSTDASIKITAKDQFTNASNIQSAQTLTVYSDSNIVNSGNIVAQKGTLSLTTKGYLESTNGHIQGYGDLNFVAERYISNLGGNVLSNNGAITFKSGEYFVNSGNMQSQLAFSVTAPQYIKNSGNIVSKSGGLGLNTQGYFENNQGSIQSGNALTLTAGKYITNSGVLWAQNDLILSAQEAINNSKQLYSKGNLQLLTVDNISNSGSMLAHGSLSIKGNAITNTQTGALAAGMDDQSNLTGNGNLTIHANSQMSLLGQQLAAGNMELRTNHLLDMQGSNTYANNLDIRSGELIASNASIKTGKNLSLDTQGQSFNTQNAALNALGDMLINVASWQNSGGSIVANGGLTITADSIVNTNGTLFAGLMNLTANSLTGDGELLSQGDMFITLQSDFINTGEVLANGKLTLSTVNRIVNNNSIIGNDVTLTSAQLINNVKGEISGNSVTLLHNNRILNYGLIDGGLVVAKTTILDNLGTGRIYGDHLALQATTLNNLNENGKGAIIAARESLNLGVKTLNNKTHSAIISLGSFVLGGSLNDKNQATGSANVINNHSAKLESGGDMLLNVNILNNINDDLRTELVKVGEQFFDVYCHLNTTVCYDVAEIVLEHIKRSRRDYWNLITPDGQKHHTFNQYTYTENYYETHITHSDPGQILSGGNLTINGQQVNNTDSNILAGGTLSINAALNNVSTTGINKTVTTGGVHIFWQQYREKDSFGRTKLYQHRHRNDYTPADIETIVDLKAGGIEQYQTITNSTINDRNKPDQVGNVSTMPPNTWLPSGPSLPVGPDGTQTSPLLPDNSLFEINPDPNANYLVETDPAFTNKKQWLGSDYMSKYLKSDPNNVMKRLGDGYYEQQLIRQQITAMTGQRYLGDFDDDTEQYKALMDAGLVYAEKFNLSVGVALTPEQMMQLTSDMVWLVKTTVTLPDGSTQDVLVPQVYVVNRPNVSTGGALLSGRDVQIKTDDNINNSGSIVSKDRLILSGDNVTNSGSLSANKISVTAIHDINNFGAIDAESFVSLKAGNDINITSSTATSQKGANEKTYIDQVASVTVKDGDIVMSAGNDVNLTAALVVNTGEDGTTLIKAGNDINLNTVTTQTKESTVFDKDNYRHTDVQNAVGTEIYGTGDVAMQAGNNITANAATVTAEKDLTLQAGNDITITTAEERSSLDAGSKWSSSGFMSKQSEETTIKTNDVTQKGSEFSGSSVTMIAGNDLNIKGSNVIATDDVALKAGNNVNIEAAEESYYSQQQTVTKKSGMMSSGGLGVTVGKMKEDLKQTDTEKGYLSSMVGSTDGNVTIIAGKDINIKGSDVIAGNDIAMKGENINVESLTSETRYQEEYTMEKSGLTLAVTGTAADVYEAAQALKRAKEGESDKILALQSIKSGLTAVKAIQDMQITNDAGNKQASIGVSASFGSEKTERELNQVQNTVLGSGISAGNNVTMIATGDKDGNGGDITIKGSEVKSGNDITLDANRDINLVASVNTQHSERKEESSSSSIGVGVSVGGDKTGFHVQGSASFSKERENMDGSAWSEAVVDAGNNLIINSGRDVNIIGGQMKGDTVIADIGGDLNIASLQDSDNYDYEKLSGSVSGSVPIGPGSASLNVSLSATEMESNWSSVTDQAGIYAGSGGFDIRVEGNTDLKGAVIASEANDALKNVLDTGTISFSDIENKADFEVNHVSVSGGTSGPGSSTSYHNKDSDSSTTHSAVEQGVIIVRDKENQQQDINDLSRDTENANNVLGEIFDKEKELENIEVAGLVSDIHQLGNDVMNNLEKQGLLGKGDADMGGDLKQALDAVTSIIQGALTGDITGGLAGAAAPYLAEEIKKQTTTMGPDGKPIVNTEANAIAHAILGAVVAQLQGGSALAGATGAVTGELAAGLIAKQLYPEIKDINDLSQEQKEYVLQLANLAAGMAGAVSGGGSIIDAGTAANASDNAVQNNSMNSMFPPAMMDYGQSVVSLNKHLQEQGYSTDEVQLALMAAGVIPKPNDLSDESRKIVDLLYEQIIPGISNERALADAIKSGNPEDLIYVALPILKGLNSLKPDLSEAGKGTSGNNLSHLTAEQQQLIKNAETISTAKPGSQVTQPRDLNEQVLWKQVQESPTSGKPLLDMNNDPRFPESAGFQKMQATHKLPDGSSITIHYQYNSNTGKAYDMKIDSTKPKWPQPGISIKDE